MEWKVRKHRTREDTERLTYHLIYKALDLDPPTDIGTSRLVVIPMFIKKRWSSEETDKHKYLVIKTGRSNNAILRIHVTAHDSGYWTAHKAKELMVCETALALNKILKFAKCNQPPITKWEDASWHLKWANNKENGITCCIWLAVVELEETTEICSHKPGKQLWRNLTDDL